MTTKNHLTPRAKLNLLIDDLRDHKIKLAEEINSRDKAVQGIVDRYAKSITDLNATIETYEAAIAHWAEENRQAEFGESKSLVLDSGAALRFRMTPKKIVFLINWTEQRILAALKRRKLRKFIRVAESVNKEQLLIALNAKMKESEAKKFGCAIDQQEKLIIELPLATAGKENK